jgi:hypothetical protein
MLAMRWEVDDLVVTICLIGARRIFIAAVFITAAAFTAARFF